MIRIDFAEVHRLATVKSLIEPIQRRACALRQLDTAVCGLRFAKVTSDDLPVVAMNEVRWQMQHDAPHRGFDPGTELQEVFAQRADLGAAR